MINRLGKVAGGLIPVMLGLVMLNILIRLIFGYPLLWAGELTKTLLLWMVFAGSAAGIVEGSHLRIDALYSCLPQPLRKTADWASFLVGAATLLYFTTSGYRLFLRYRGFRAWLYVIPPLGGLLLLAGAVENLRHRLRNKVIPPGLNQRPRSFGQTGWGR